MSLGPDARSFLDSVRDGDEPTSADEERVHARLALRLGIAAGAGASATAAAGTKTAAAMTATATAKAAAGAGATAGAGAAATAGGAASIAPAAGAVAGVSLTTKLALAVAIAGSTATAVTVYETKQAPVVAAVATASPSGSWGPTAPLVRSAHEPPPLPAPSARGAFVLRTNAGESASAASDRAGASSAASERPSASSAPRRGFATRPSAGSPPAPDSLRDESLLLRGAHASLAEGDPAAALARLDDHTTRFPAGALSEERQAARVHALCAAGRGAEARAAAASFVAAHPSSALAPAVRRSCATATDRDRNPPGP